VRSKKWKYRAQMRHKTIEHGVKSDLDAFQIDRPRVDISAQNRRDIAGDRHTQVTIAAPP
jgi:hypothetical protein